MANFEVITAVNTTSTQNVAVGDTITWFNSGGAFGTNNTPQASGCTVTFVRNVPFGEENQFATEYTISNFTGSSYTVNRTGTNLSAQSQTWRIQGDIGEADNPPTTPSTFTISDSSPSLGSTITLTASGSTDADDDTIAYQFRMRTSTDSGSNYGTYTAWSSTNTFTVPLEATSTTRYQFQARAIANNATSDPTSALTATPEISNYGMRVQTGSGNIIADSGILMTNFTPVDSGTGTSTSIEVNINTDLVFFRLPTAPSSGNVTRVFPAILGDANSLSATTGIMTFVSAYSISSDVTSHTAISVDYIVMRDVSTINAPETGYGLVVKNIAGQQQFNSNAIRAANSIRLTNVYEYGAYGYNAVFPGSNTRQYKALPGTFADNAADWYCVAYQVSRVDQSSWGAFSSIFGVSRHGVIYDNDNNVGVYPSSGSTTSSSIGGGGLDPGGGGSNTDVRIAKAQFVLLRGEMI